MDTSLSHRSHLSLYGVILILILASISIAGCGGQPKLPEKLPPPPPPTLTIRITATDDVNRGADGQGRAVVVRAYELKGHGVFANADFFSLYDRDAEVLGGDLLDRDEVTLTPGQFVPISRPLNPEAAYVGVIAAFREIDQARWRGLLRLTPGTNNKLVVEVGARAISIRYQ